MTHPTLELIRAITAVYYHPPTVCEDDRIAWRRGSSLVVAYQCEFSGDCIFDLEHCASKRRVGIISRQKTVLEMLRQISDESLAPWWRTLDICFARAINNSQRLKPWEHELTPKEDV